MIQKTFLTVLLLFSPFLSFAAITSPGTYYVTADTLNVRLAPSSSATTTNKLYRQQKVQVYEIKGEWARISEYYSSMYEGGLKQQVARWVSTKYLSANKPADKPQPKIKEDPRINGIPKVGEYGLTEKDVQILYNAAHHYLNTGKCRKIEMGDKSTSKPNTYYLNCGGKNLFFKPNEIPQSN